MEDADLSREIPVTPVRSSSENSGLVSNYSEATGGTATTTGPPGNANDSIASSALVPPSPQRSFTNPLPPSVPSTPEPVSRPDSFKLSPQVVRTTTPLLRTTTPLVRTTTPLVRTATPLVRTTTPLPPKSHMKDPILPDLQTPQFNDAAGPVEEGDLLGNYALEEPPQFSVETPEPRVLLYPLSDEETDPTSSITADFPTHARNDATSTFGKAIQPLKEKIKNRSNSADEEGEQGILPGVIIFGYLQKQGRNGKWQTRWFESDGECLTYYKSSKRVKILATLDLAKVGYILVNYKDPNGSSFTINIKNRPYHLRADSKVSCNDWVITLNRIKEARLRQGNVKLVNSQPPDLLDIVAPRVVVVAARQRTHAVDDDDVLQWEGNSWNENPAAEEEFIYDPTNSKAKWQKSTRQLSRFAGKVLRWARSIRRYGCTSADEQVVLDRHVHPPGHDDGKRPGRSKMPTVIKAPASQGQAALSSEPTNDSLTLGRSMSMEDARELS